MPRRLHEAAKLPHGTSCFPIEKSFTHTPDAGPRRRLDPPPTPRLPIWKHPPSMRTMSASPAQSPPPTPASGPVSDSTPKALLRDPPLPRNPPLRAPLAHAPRSAPRCTQALGATSALPRRSPAPPRNTSMPPANAPPRHAHRTARASSRRRAANDGNQFHGHVDSGGGHLRPPAVLDMQAELELPVLGSRVCVRDEYTVALPGPEPLNRRLRTNTGLSHRAIR